MLIKRIPTHLGGIAPGCFLFSAHTLPPDYARPGAGVEFAWNGDNGWRPDKIVRAAPQFHF
jgi:hypothetical protein